ncbi:uncharacterized protein LOC103720435 [Phoenix dactylifera]|uniref:Uncharacterized protein LOC103720435 n=1 Tax=Phoenix dactylifera TaxID=42345 RepID=A0A8B7CXN3_PHODC|nr:uncharacterized protein LOC103720435 [Phoenix dactylifera]
MASAEDIRWARISTVALGVATAAISVAAAFVSASIARRKSRRLASHVRELEASLASALEKGASERRGRVRAQQALRKALAKQSYDGLKQASSSSFSYPMAPIGTVQSCFSTRNGTPRQPPLVPLARACLVFDPSRVPPEALEGLADYSHCWILYVFHLNTDLDRLWNEPSRSKFKAKVRVPRLKGGKMGILSTRSPHRPCPIGLTVAKVEALDGHAILLSGVDLVDGTPVLDIKPYLPYSDSINGATVPEWLKAENSLAVASVSFSAGFASSLSSCWIQAENQSLYASPEEFQSLIKEVLSWEIRSLSQRSRPHHVFLGNASHNTLEELVDDGDGDPHDAFTGKALSSSVGDITYHLILEGLDVSYRIDDRSNIMVEKVDLASNARNQNRYNYSMWRDKLKQQK